LAICLLGCGYRVVGASPPFGMARLAVLPFAENSPVGLSPGLAGALASELAASGVAITTDVTSADGVLRGLVASADVAKSPTSTDPAARIPAYRLAVRVEAQLTDRAGLSAGARAWIWTKTSSRTPTTCPPPPRRPKRVAGAPCHASPSASLASSKRGSSSQPPPGRTMPPRTDFERHLGSDDLLPVYALFSVEVVLLSDAVTKLRGKSLTAAPDFNRDEFRAGAANMDQVVRAATTMPMMAPRRWVHVSSIDDLKAKDADPLLRYLEKPSPSTVLCLSGEKLDGRTKVGQVLTKMGAAFLFEPPRQKNLAEWIERRAKGRGYAIQRDAVGLLADVVGTDLGTIDMALDKLWTYAGGKPITHDDVEATVAPTRVHSIFELTDAIGARDLGRASLLLRNSIDSGESALRVLGMITRQLRQLLNIKTMPGARSGEIASALGLPPFLAQSLMDQARRYQRDELCRALDAAAAADVRLKSTRLDAGIVLDRLLVEMITS
jgi:DNA polymerase III subunit delta